MSMERRIALWALGGDTGLSSQAIALATLHGTAHNTADYPYDLADLGRCILSGPSLTRFGQN